MYPYLRLLKLLATKKTRKKLVIGDESVLPMRVCLVDIDPFMELNNGRHLTMMDFGRFDLALRSGLISVVKQKGWGLAVAGASVRYRHRLKLMQKYTLHSQVVGYDDRWFYFHQKTIRHGKVHSAALIRTAITSKNGIVKTRVVLETMGYDNINPTVPDWVAAWAAADELRPWE
ncbi:MAG: thioesterase family protein [Bacteroidetes bacterium]|nr:thioesterase family protein [Bacteroidota bacterium]MBL6944143.1 thioesterase family protein [Bacteroidales bacterium]